MRVICPYCEQPTKLVTGADVYPHRPDLHGLRFYLCKPCDAWVGCHRGTTKPLGRLANAELRSAKMRAHAAFDPLWKAKMRHDQCSKSAARKAAYTWLATRMGIDVKDCHIGMFDLAQCDRVVSIVKEI